MKQPQLDPGTFRAMEGELEMEFIVDSGELGETKDEWTLHLMKQGYSRKQINQFFKLF